ncbi:hypothetical protein OBE_04402, partial [human gut metagenome]
MIQTSGLTKEIRILPILRFWFFAGAAPNTTYTNGIWNSLYDGIGSCNMAISLANKAPFKTEAERNVKVAEARFLRA